MREGVEVRLRPGDQERLESVVPDRNSPQHHAWRARFVLMTADDAGTMAIRTATGNGEPTVRRWQARYMRNGADGLSRDAPRGCAFAAALPEQIIAVVERTLQEDPPAATHWTLCSMAKASGLALSTIHRIWREHGLKRHRFETFKLPNDPRFVEKLRDIVGLYVNPPAHALVLSVKEKSQIQALDRIQPGLQLKRGHGATITSRIPVAITALDDHDVVINYGRVGSLVTAGLRTVGCPVLVLGDTKASVTAARAAGIETVQGNAADPEVLAAANLAAARRLFVTVPKIFEGGQVVRQACAANPALEVLGRAHSDAGVSYLRRLGADQVIMVEWAVAYRMLDDMAGSQVMLYPGLDTSDPTPRGV